MRRKTAGVTYEMQCQSWAMEGTPGSNRNLTSCMNMHMQCRVFCGHRLGLVFSVEELPRMRSAGSGNHF